MHRYELVVQDVGRLTGNDSLVIDEVTHADEFGIGRVVCKRLADSGAVTPITPPASA